MHEFLRRLVDPGTGDLTWGEGTRLPYIILGNELERAENDYNCAETAWWILRTSQILQQCAPDVIRIFPGLHHPRSSALGEPEGQDGDCGRFVHALPHARRVACALDRIFFHIVRAAVIVQWQESAGSRFVQVLGEGVRDGYVSLLDYLGHHVPTGDLFDLRYSEHSTLVKQWAIERGLTAPFHVMDFHWYGSKLGSEAAAGVGESFEYLWAVADVVDEVRARLGEWWVSGIQIPLWCSETGISSHQNPDFVGTGEFKDYEVRVDPSDLFTTFVGPPGHGDYAAADVRGWPSWAFTDETEQARQVWTRLSYLAGIGVERVFWYTNEDDPVRADTGEYQDFFSYGVTADLVDDQPLDYRKRGKKRSFCALQRWNTYLDGYLSARIVPGLDGRAGFYAVLFRRHESSPGASDYPYALVAWADAQAYEALSSGSPSTPPPCDGGGRWIRITPNWALESFGWGQMPLRVATVPRHAVVIIPGCTDLAPAEPSLFLSSQEAATRRSSASAESSPVCAVVNPCLCSDCSVETGTPGVDYDPAGGLWRFEADRELEVSGIRPPRAEVIIRTDEDPILLLLSDGALEYQDGEGGIRMGSVSSFL
ncbi:hypothetical protein L6R50_16865 [Myxococcota bacterium]|nr:hypothetical protein [Myxococcota bacterium]